MKISSLNKLRVHEWRQELDETPAPHPSRSSDMLALIDYVFELEERIDNLYKQQREIR